MSRKHSNTQRSTRGAVAVEFALVLVPFMLMVMCILDYGWFFFIDLSATNAAREAARTATTVPGGCPNTTATTLGRAAATGYLAAAGLGRYPTTVTPECTTDAMGAPTFRFQIRVVFPRLTGASGILRIPMPAAAGYSSDYVAATTQATMRGVP